MDAVVALVTLIPPRKTSAIANRVRGSGFADPRTLDGLLSTPPARAALRRVFDAWAESSVPGDFLAGLLIGAAHAHRKTQEESTVELVWTGPTTSFVATRRTAQVLLDLIHRAKHDVFLVSFVAYDVPAVVDALNEASNRGVAIRILLESSTSHGGSLTVDPIATMGTSLPSAELYAWLNRSGSFIDGKVHAKVAVADGQRAFVTSANLTGHALEKNMEAGVLIQGSTLPNSLRSHLQALIDTNAIQRVFQ